MSVSPFRRHGDFDFAGIGQIEMRKQIQLFAEADCLHLKVKQSNANSTLLHQMCKESIDGIIPLSLMPVNLGHGAGGSSGAGSGTGFGC
jgi:hypothetical protein